MSFCHKKASPLCLSPTCVHAPINPHYFSPHRQTRPLIYIYRKHHGYTLSDCCMSTNISSEREVPVWHIHRRLLQRLLRREQKSPHWSISPSIRHNVILTEKQFVGHRVRPPDRIFILQNKMQVYYQLKSQLMLIQVSHVENVACLFYISAQIQSSTIL